MSDQALTVLHAEPDAAFSDDVERALSAALDRVEVTHVDDFPAAVKALAERRFDCVVAEQSLGGEGTGLDLLRHVRADPTDGDRPFVLLTGGGSEALAADAIGAGVTDYLRKDGGEGDGGEVDRDDVLDRLSERIARAVTRHRADRANRGRTRELSTLHAVASALAADEALEDRLWRVVEALPTGWQRDDRAAARIEVDGLIYETPGFTERTDVQRATTAVGDTTVTVSVAYVDTPKDGSSGSNSESAALPGSESDDPFTSMEAELLRTVADLVAAHVDRAETVERLRAFAERLETILQHTTNVVFMKDLEGRYVLVNRAFEEFVDLDGEAILGRRAEDLFDADTAARMREHDAKTLAAGELRRFEERYVSDGERRRFVTVRVPLFDTNDEPYAVYGIATDITEETRLAEERIELLDRMTDGFFAVDEDDEITYLNDRAAELIDVDPDAVVGERLWDEFPVVRDTAFQAAFERAKHAGEPVSRTDYYEPSDRWFESRFYPSNSGVSVYFRDVTETVRERQEIRQREETMRRLHEIVADKDATFEGKTRSLLALGKEVLDVESGLLSRVDGEEYVAEIAADDTGQFEEGVPVPLSATNCERVVTTENSLRVDDVESVPELAERSGHTEMGISCYVGAPVIVDGEVYGTCCFYDRDARIERFTEWETTLVDLIARWMSYELEHRRHTAELGRERDRLDAFAGMISHDLRNPLSVAAGHVDLVREEHDFDSLDRAAHALDRMAELIDDALSFARLGAPVVDTETVDLAHIAEEAWGTVDTDGAELRLADPGRAVGDASRVRTLFENLFRNAVEHAGADATVEVGRTDDGFYVADDGPGIPEDAREQAFELGYTTREGGTGFGLAIVSQIAEAHGWTARIDTGADGGARIVLGGVNRPATLEEVSQG